MCKSADQLATEAMKEAQRERSRADALQAKLDAAERVIDAADKYIISPYNKYRNALCDVLRAYHDTANPLATKDEATR